MKKINFYSGPAILPQEVVEKAKAALDDFAGTGLSILEISHRAKPFVEVMDGARALVKELMSLNDDYEVLFLQGGASTQFYMIPYNLLNEDETAAFYDTGTWAHGALEEAKNFGKIKVIGSSADANYSFIPKVGADSGHELKGYKYVHITTNNTIYGTQWSIEEIAKLRPQVSCLVGDMSSDIFSREIDYTQFDLIYAGAQKNMGAAGTTLVVVKKSILGKVRRAIPKMIDYHVQIENGSMKNTPSVFAVYISYLTLQWIKERGIKSIATTNGLKAQKLYNAIDNSDIFEGTVAEDNRSEMNVCFKIVVDNASELEKQFSVFAKERGIVGIEGHRSVGGFRASVYNAMPESGIDTLISAMRDFEQNR